jgi:hypothetical protein
MTEVNYTQKSQIDYQQIQISSIPRLALKTIQSVAATGAVDVVASAIGLGAANRTEPIIAANIDAPKMASVDTSYMTGSVKADLLINNTIIKPMSAGQLIIWNLGDGWEPRAKHWMF